jgi:hypothetical protein
MSVKILRTTLHVSSFEVQAFAFIPDVESLKEQWACFTHGYTSQKSDCLPWATRTAEGGIPTIIFDQPGHYLGSFNDVESFEDFKNNVHLLFKEAYLRLGQLIEAEHGFANYPACQGLILGGHSLGALTAIKALDIPELASVKKVAICIGMGLNVKAETHIFDTTFYQKTLSIRRQLVSPAIDSSVVFPWIREEKINLKTTNHRIHLITGEDDAVVGPGGLKLMTDKLIELGNDVSFYEPKRLPHHEPGQASPHIFAFLKDYFGW